MPLYGALRRSHGVREIGIVSDFGRRVGGLPDVGKFCPIDFGKLPHGLNTPTNELRSNIETNIRHKLPCLVPQVVKLALESRSSVKLHPHRPARLHHAQAQAHEVADAGPKSGS